MADAYRVLVPVDADEGRALRQAQFVGDLPGAAESVEATLLFVFGRETEELPEELERFKSASRVASVRRAREHLEGAGVSVEVMDESGDTAQDIVDLAEDLDVDLIVMGGRKRSPAAKVLFGSITQAVLLHTDRPVVVTGTRP